MASSQTFVAEKRSKAVAISFAVWMQDLDSKKEAAMPAAELAWKEALRCSVAQGFQKLGH
jgi:hypothetical protein